jgi:hypothetical protein
MSTDTLPPIAGDHRHEGEKDLQAPVLQPFTR